MKKYLKLLFVALFATMTVSLYSCKDDKDEPDGGSTPSGNLKDFNFTVNGTKFYYVQDDSDIFSDMGITVSGDDSYSLMSTFSRGKNNGIIELQIDAYNNIPTFNDVMKGFPYTYMPNSITKSTSFQLFLEPFDYENAKNGDELKFTEGWYVPQSNNLSKSISNAHLGEYKDGKEIDYSGFSWYSYDQRLGSEKMYGSCNYGKIKFVSYKDERLTLNFEGFVMQIDEDHELPPSEYYQMSGTIVFEKTKDWEPSPY